MVSEYECKCEDCMSYHRHSGGKNKTRLRRLNEQSMMKEFVGWRDEVKEFYNNVCAKCGGGDKLHIDHIEPLSLGGDHAIYNMQVLCRSCNITKSNRNSTDYRPYPRLIAIIFP